MERKKVDKTASEKSRRNRFYNASHQFGGFKSAVNQNYRVKRSWLTPRCDGDTLLALIAVYLTINSPRLKVSEIRVLPVLMERCIVHVSG